MEDRERRTGDCRTLKKRSGLQLGWVAALCIATLTTAFTSLAAPLRIGYLFPNIEYDSETSLKWIAQQMESKYAARSFWFKGQDISEGSSEATPTVIANLNDLDSLDVLVIFIRRVWLNPQQTTKLKSFLNSGKGIVGIRSACHAIQSWDLGRGIDSVIFGGVYNNHGANNGYDLEFTAESKTHPIFKDVQSFKADHSLYYQNYGGRTVASDVNILMYGKSVEGRFPVTWTRQRMGSNIFFTSTGVQVDFQNPQFQKMIINAVLWSGKALGGTTAVWPSPSNALATSRYLSGRSNEEPGVYFLRPHQGSRTAEAFLSNGKLIGRFQLLRARYGMEARYGF